MFMNEYIEFKLQSVLLRLGTVSVFCRFCRTGMEFGFANAIIHNALF